MDKNLVDEVVAAAAREVAGGAISANGHGNVSLRVPGAEEMYFTSAPSLRGLGPEGVVRVGLDGTLLEGHLPPIQGAVVAMHTAMYHDRPDVGCVVYTHSPLRQETTSRASSGPPHCASIGTDQFTKGRPTCLTLFEPRQRNEPRWTR